MTSDSDPESLIKSLYDEKAILLEEVMLKSGVLSPIYIDLRVLTTTMEILEKTADLLYRTIIDAKLDFDYVVGVPYGGIALAVLVARHLRKPMLLKRKEAKNYGKKQLIEGRFEPGKRALIIEDVVTSGASILETVEVLRKAELVCDDVVCVLDREQGGKGFLKDEGINLFSVLSMTSILNYMVNEGHINEKGRDDIQDRLKSTVRRPPAIRTLAADARPPSNGESLNGESPEVKRKAPPKCGLTCELDSSSKEACPAETEESSAVGWSLRERMPLFEKNPLNKRLAEIILKKRTNVCLAADYTSMEEILKLVDKTKDWICALKLHCDIIDGFNRDFIDELQQKANDHDFLIFEDRKFGDTGETMHQQLTQGYFKVAEWADLVTLHAVPGSASINALKPVVQEKEFKLSGALLVAQMSTEGSLTDDQYIEKSVQLANANASVISGFICQRRCHKSPKFLYWTPGVNSSSTRDEKGQRWRTVEQAITEDGCDIIVVGRGITKAADVASEARQYAKAGWDALSQREWGTEDVEKAFP